MVAHHEPPHQDLRCLQIQLFSSLVLKEKISKFKPSSQIYRICISECVKRALNFVFSLQASSQNELLVEG